MRVSSIVCSSAYLLAALAGTVAGDIGGGSGRAITPYDGTEVTLQQVLDQRERGRRSIVVRQLKVSGVAASKTCYKAGFAYDAGQGPITDVRYRLEGVDGSGAARSVDLAEMESFRLVTVDGDDAVLEVSQFPAISPEALLRLKPTYSALVQEYKQRVVLRVPLRRDGHDLFLVGTSWHDDPSYARVAKLRDMVPQRTIELRSWLLRDGLWWAIDSVVADATYPHRVVMKR